MSVRTPVGWLIPADSYDPRFPANNSDLDARPVPVHVDARGHLRLATECGECGGDGVLIDDDPESTRQIVSTCHRCDGLGTPAPSDPKEEQK